jgi:hypothetical protein
MEDLMQDQDTVIQQLRLLLAAKEEEMHALKGRTEHDSGEEHTDSITDQLLKEIEDKKRETTDLKARLKEVEAKAKEKLARMASALEEKVEMIASLQDRPAQAVVEDEEARRRIAELEERLGDQAALLAEAREALEHAEAQSAAPAEGKPAGAGSAYADGTREEEIQKSIDEARAEIDRLQEELRESRIVRANLELAAEERDRARAEEARLSGELDAARKKLDESERGHAERVAELQQRLDLLQGSLDAAAAAAAAGKDGEGSEAESLPVFQRIRTLEAELQERELSYRTTQAKLHRTTQNQQILRGLCAGLCVFLIFIISMKARQPSNPKAEIVHETSPPGALAAGRAAAPAVDIAKGGALRDSDFLPAPEAELTGIGAAASGPASAPAVAEAPAIPAIESAPPANAAGLAEPAAETQVAAKEPAKTGGLPVEVQFVEASTLALGPAAAPVVASARDGAKNSIAKGAAETLSSGNRAGSHPAGGRVPYTVKNGESLWTICQRELGNGGAMGRVARENKITNPNTVKAGDVIYLSRQ